MVFKPKFLLFILFGLVVLGCQSRQEVSYQKNTLKKHEQAALYNVQLGLAYLEQQDSVRAKAKLITAFDLAPNSPTVLGAMASYFETIHDFEKAQEFYKKALVLAPEDGALLNNYGVFLCKHKQYAQAELYFNKAANNIRYLHTANAYENAGFCAKLIPDDTKAIYYFTKALQHDPKRTQILKELTVLKVKYDSGAKHDNNYNNGRKTVV